MRQRSRVFYRTERVEQGVWTIHSLQAVTEPRLEVVPLDLLLSDHEYLQKRQKFIQNSVSQGMFAIGSFV